MSTYFQKEKKIVQLFFFFEPFLASLSEVSIIKQGTGSIQAVHLDGPTSDYPLGKGILWITCRARPTFRAFWWVF